MSRKYDLTYYVYVENINKHRIEKYNVLNDFIIDTIKKRTVNILNKNQFAEVVDDIMLYYYHFKSEWEIILTDWPTHLKLEELARLNSEQEKYQKDYGHSPYSLTVNLSTEEKIDVYDQITMNWNIFIDYIWKNLGGEL